MKQVMLYSFEFYRSLLPNYGYMYFAKGRYTLDIFAHDIVVRTLNFISKYNLKN